MFDKELLKEYCKKNLFNTDEIYDIKYGYETVPRYYYIVTIKRGRTYHKREYMVLKTVYNKSLIEKRIDKINKIKCLIKN